MTSPLSEANSDQNTRGSAFREGTLTGRQAGNKRTDRWFSSFPVGLCKREKGQ